MVPTTTVLDRIHRRDTPELSPAEEDAVNAFVDAQWIFNTWEGRDVPATVSDAYETAYNGLPRWYRDLVDEERALRTSSSTLFTQTPYASTMVLGEMQLENYINGGFQQFGMPDCGPTNRGNPFPAVATVPTMATATSTFTIHGSNASCFPTATRTSDSGIYGPTLTLGSSGFTRSMTYSAIEGPCPKFYTLDVVYPLGESPHPYTTMHFRDIVYHESLGGICCPIATATTDVWKFYGTVCTRTITADKNNPTPQTPLVIPYHIRWNGYRKEFATSTVSGENWVSTVVADNPKFNYREDSINGEIASIYSIYGRTAIGTTTGVTIPAFTVSKLETPTGLPSQSGQTKDNSKILWPIIGTIVGTFLIFAVLGHYMIRRRRRGPRTVYNPTPPRPIERPPPPAEARTRTSTATPARRQPERELPVTLQPEQIDPPPIYSPDPRDDEVMLSRLDPVSTTSSGDRVGRSMSVGGTSDGHLSWTHLEIPSPGYSPSSTGRGHSPAASVGGGSGRVLLDVPAEPAPAYTVLRD